MHRFVSRMIAGLALSAAVYAVPSAQPARHQAGEVEILLDGTPQRRYAHDGRWYVEALKGREYAIRLRNPYPVRVAVALSVDGLNTIDARHTDAATARKWVLEPYQAVTISGWQINRAEARRFEFTTEARSYGQALGQTANLGVISAAFFQGTRGGNRSRVAARARRARRAASSIATARRASASYGIASAFFHRGVSRHPYWCLSLNSVSGSTHSPHFTSQ